MIWIGMALLDLPLELFHQIVEVTIAAVGLAETIHLRLVNSMKPPFHVLMSWLIPKGLRWRCSAYFLQRRIYEFRDPPKILSYAPFVALATFEFEIQKWAMEALYPRHTHQCCYRAVLLYEWFWAFLFPISSIHTNSPWGRSLPSPGWGLARDYRANFSRNWQGGGSPRSFSKKKQCPIYLFSLYILQTCLKNVIALGLIL